MSPLDATLELFRVASYNRFLDVNQLTGPIPWTIGQLTALGRMYVVVLAIVAAHFLRRAQGARCQPPDRTNAVYDWQIDGTLCVVRSHVGFSVADSYSCCAHRDCARNQLTGPMPPAIGQLTALTFLYGALFSCW